MDILTFDGYLHIEDFLVYIQTMEKFFEYMGIEEEQRVNTPSSQPISFKELMLKKLFLTISGP